MDRGWPGLGSGGSGSARRGPRAGAAGLRSQGAEAEADLQALEDEWSNTSEELDRLSKEADKWYTPPSSYGDGEERFNAAALRRAVTEIAVLPV